MNRTMFIWVAALLLALPVTSLSAPLGDVTDISREKDTLIIACGDKKVRLEMWADDVVRVWLSDDGKYDGLHARGNRVIRPGIEYFKGPSELHIDDTEDYLGVSTKTLHLLVNKKPFGLAFYQADGKTLLTATSPGLGLDTDVKVSLKRDASGTQEHFVGLQLKNDSQTLDHRDKTVSLKDKNGAGWVAPFFMSSAGYGVFFNNEFSVDNQISFHENILIENTKKRGQLDLFFFRGPSYRRMLDLYTNLTGKPSMPPKKLLGYNYLVKGTAFLEPVLDEEAFHEWIKRGYPIDNCITFTDQALETDKELAAVSATAKRVHAANGRLTCYFDLYSPGTFQKFRPWPTKYPYSDWNAFKATVKKRLLDRGVDDFWIDETENIPYVNELYQALVEVSEAQDKRRGYICGRGGQAGCQRFGYPWMGDTPYNKSSTLTKLCNGLIGVAHSTADMGGMFLSRLSEQQFLSGVKENLLNPITQCNAWVPAQTPCHKPWEWSPSAEHVFKKYLELHYQLVPYFYTMFWQSHRSGLPDFRPLFLDYPDRVDYYARDEFMIGDWLLLAPLYKETARDVCLPPGIWYGYFDGARYQGDQIVKDYHPTVEGYPLFVKSGAIIPMAQPMRYIDENPNGPLLLDIYPDGDSSTMVYEDDGITRDYKKGIWCITRVACKAAADSTRISLAKREGPYQQKRKSVLVKVLASTCPKEVKLAGRKLDRVDTLETLMERKQGWGFFPDPTSGAYKVFAIFGNTGEAAELTITHDPHSQVPPQPSGQAVFTALIDTNRDGRSLQGTDGVWTPSDAKNMPDYASVSVSGGTLTSWEKTSKEAHPQVPFALVGQKLQINLDIKGGTSCLVALNVLGKSGEGNSTKVEVVDPVTGRRFDTRVLSNGAQSVNLIYTIKGRVTINVTSPTKPGVGLSRITFGWLPELEFKGTSIVPAESKPPILGTAGRWFFGKEKALPTGTTVKITGAPATLTSGKASTEMNRRIKQLEIRVTDPMILTFCLQDKRNIKPKDWFAGAMKGITVEAVDLPGNRKIDHRFLSPSFGSCVYLQYQIFGNVKFTFTDTDQMQSILSALYFDPLAVQHLRP